MGGGLFPLPPSQVLLQLCISYKTQVPISTVDSSKVRAHLPGGHWAET